MQDVTPHTGLQASHKALIISNKHKPLNPIVNALKDLPFLQAETLLLDDTPGETKQLQTATVDVLFVVVGKLTPDSAKKLKCLIADVPEHPIIAVSGYSNHKYTQPLISEGLQEYLSCEGLANQPACQRVIEHAILRHQREQTLRQFMQRDLLTGLHNRSVFTDQLNQRVLSLKRTKGLCAILVINIDSFVNVNEVLGHDKADQLLVDLADRLRHSLREIDIIARFGHDEFAVIIDPGKDMYGAVKVADNLMAALRKEFMIDGHDMHITVSIGIAASIDGKIGADEMLKQANIALTKAKKAGGNVAQYFTPELAANARVRMMMQDHLYRAIKNNEFFMVYQPQFDISGRRVVGLESLIRWKHPQRGIIPPDAFVPLLEETGLIVEVTDWIIQSTSIQRMQWQQQGIIDNDTPIAINISARQFVDSSLIDSVQSVIHKVGIEPQQLDLELTETYLMDDMNVTVQRLKELKKIGVQLSIDDFGTGYSSLGYLKSFPIDSIKIDKSFVDNVPNDRDDTTIVRAIVGLSHNLGYGLVAEGVETAEQHRFLQQLGCESFQGYLFSKPLDTKNLETLLRQTRAEAKASRPNRRILQRQQRPRRKG